MKNRIRPLTLLLATLLAAPAAAQSLDATRIPGTWIRPLGDGRTPVSTLPSSPTATRVINQSGSYFLDRNLLGEPGKAGIEVNASDVTLDLMGFTVKGVGTSQDGIRLLSGETNLRISNGTIRDWPGQGIAASSGSSIAELCRLDKLRVMGNGSRGALIGEGSRIEHSLFAGNSIGIEARSTDILGCVIAESSSTGVSVTGPSSVRLSIARNTDNGNGSAFVLLDGSGLLEECVANRGNIVINGSSENQAISKVRRSVVAGSLAPLGGLHANTASVLEDNLSTRHSFYAINVSGPGACHVEGNLATTSGPDGLRVTSFGVALRNASTGNAGGDNWDFSNNVAAGSFLAPGSITSSNPFGHPLF